MSSAVKHYFSWKSATVPTPDDYSIVGGAFNRANKDALIRVFLPKMFISTGITQGQRLDNCFLVMEGRTYGVRLLAHYMENSGDLDLSQVSRATVRKFELDNYTNGK